MIPPISDDCFDAVLSRATQDEFSSFAISFIKELKEKQPDFEHHLRSIIEGISLAGSEECKDKSMEDVQNVIIVSIWACLGVSWKCTEATLEAKDMQEWEL